MARNTTALLDAEFNASSLSPIFLAEFEFDSGTIRFWTGYGTVSWNGFDWTGAGELLEISPVVESSTIQATNLEYQLSGVPTSLISIAFNETYQQRPASLYIGALDSAGTIVVSPYKIFEGFMDVMDIQEGADYATIRLAVENELVALERVNKHLYTAERQKVDYPTDRGFDSVSDIQEKELVWHG